MTDSRTKITPEERDALVWFAARRTVSWFPVDGPTREMRRVLKAKSLIEAVPPESSEVIRYRISKAGRDAISTRAKA